MITHTPLHLDAAVTDAAVNAIEEHRRRSRASWGGVPELRPTAAGRAAWAQGSRLSAAVARLREAGVARADAFAGYGSAVRAQVAEFGELDDVQGVTLSALTPPDGGAR